MIFLVSIRKANIGHKMPFLCDFSLAAKDKKGGRSRANIADSAQTEYCTTFHCLCVCVYLCFGVTSQLFLII